MFWSSRKQTELSVDNEHVVVHPTAEIGADVSIGPFTYIGPNCRVGDGCNLHNNVSLLANTVLGENNEIYPGAVIGADPQDKKFEGEDSWVLIGDGNIVRECVTIHLGTRHGGGNTVIGNNNLLMACCHVAHDCILGDGITMANNVLLGGHVVVENNATFGGLAAVHHFTTVGESAFIGGMARISLDVPPYMLVEGSPMKVWSINKVGLKRQGFTAEAVESLKEAHRCLYREDYSRVEALKILRDKLWGCREVQTLVNFLDRADQGHKGRARQPSCE